MRAEAGRDFTEMSAIPECHVFGRHMIERYHCKEGVCRYKGIRASPSPLRYYVLAGYPSSSFTNLYALLSETEC